MPPSSCKLSPPRPFRIPPEVGSWGGVEEEKEEESGGTKQHWSAFQCFHERFFSENSKTGGDRASQWTYTSRDSLCEWSRSAPPAFSSHREFELSPYSSRGRCAVLVD